MQRGIATVEVLIALAIASSIITTTTALTLGMPTALENARLKRDAYAYASRLLAEAEQTSFRQLGDVKPLSTTTEGIYRGSLAVDYLFDELAARITASISWLDIRGNEAHISITSLITDVELARDISCSPFLLETWRAPAVYATYDLVPGDLLPAEFPELPYSATSIAAHGNHLLVGSHTTTTATQPTLFFFSLDTSGRPTFVTATDNTPLSRTGISDITVGGNHAFIANGFGSASSVTCAQADGCAQVHAYNLESLTPTRSTSFQLATHAPPYARTTSGASASAKSITYRRGFLFLGLEKTDGGFEFNIIDVREPESPKWVSGLAIGRSVEHIAVTRTHAYLATSDSAQELIIVDIQNIENPVVAGSWNAPGATNFGLGSFVQVRGPHTFFGRTYTGNAPEFTLLHTENPAQIVPIAPIDTNTLANPGSVRGIVVRESLATVMAGQTIHFWDIENPLEVQEHSESIDLGSEGTGLICRDQILIGSSENNGVGRIHLIKGS